jgi:hypothetical protein
MVRSKRAGQVKAIPREASLTERIPTASIDWRDTLRPINIEHVERLAGAAQLPAIHVWEFQPGRYRGIDGYHRWRLAKHRRENVVEAVIRHFPAGAAGEKAYEIECVRSNLQHGLPLSPGDRNRAIKRLWSRWGRAEGRPDGYTLDELGQLFNLTKQRVHQILLVTQTSQAGTQDDRRSTEGDAGPDVAAVRGRPRTGAIGRFSTFGRFSAATHRMANLLRDAEFMSGLLGESRSEVIEQLQGVRRLIDEVVRLHP